MHFPLALTRPLMTFDIESTGTNPKTARIVEISMVRLDPDGTLTPWKTLVNPECPIPAGATEKHTITDDQVRDARTFAQLAPGVLRGFTGVDLCGYNIKRYDVELLEAEFKRAGIVWDPQDCCVIDPFKLWQLLYPRTLSDFVETFLKRTATAAHRAEADAMDALEGFVAFYEQHKDRLPDTLKGLHDFQWPVDPNAVAGTRGKVKWNDAGTVMMLTFGKHANTPLQSVPRSYLDWLLTTDMPFEMRRILTDAKQGRFSMRAL